MNDICTECKMLNPGQYHPYLFCLLYKAGVRRDIEGYLRSYGFVRVEENAAVASGESS